MERADINPVRSIIIPAFDIKISQQAERKLYHFCCLIEHQISKIRRVQFDGWEIGIGADLCSTLSAFSTSLQRLTSLEAPAQDKASEVEMMYDTANRQKIFALKRGERKKSQCQKAIRLILEQVAAIKTRVEQLVNTSDVAIEETGCDRNEVTWTALWRLEGMINEAMDLAGEAGQFHIEVQILDNLCDVSKQLRRFVSSVPGGGGSVGSRASLINLSKADMSTRLFTDERYQPIPVDEEASYPLSVSHEESSIYGSFLPAQLGHPRTDRTYGTSEEEGEGHRGMNGLLSEITHNDKRNREYDSGYNSSAAFADDVFPEDQVWQGGVHINMIRGRGCSTPNRLQTAVFTGHLSPPPPQPFHHGHHVTMASHHHLMLAERIPSYMPLHSVTNPELEIKQSNFIAEKASRCNEPASELAHYVHLGARMDSVMNCFACVWLLLLGLMLIGLMLRNHSCYCLEGYITDNVEYFVRAGKPFLRLRHFGRPTF